jgi:hypothetical protein
METTVALGTVVRVLSPDLQRVVSIGAVERVRGKAAWVRKYGWVNLARLAPLSGRSN